MVENLGPYKIGMQTNTYIQRKQTNPDIQQKLFIKKFVVVIDILKTILVVHLTLQF